MWAMKDYHVDIIHAEFSSYMTTQNWIINWTSDCLYCRSRFFLETGEQNKLMDVVDLYVVMLSVEIYRTLLPYGGD